MVISYFGLKLKALRLSHDVGQRELARYLRTSHKSIGAVENGECPVLSRNLWPALMSVFPQLSHEELVTWERRSRPVEFDLASIGEEYHGLVLALRNAIREDVLSEEAIEKIETVLRASLEHAS